MPVTFVWIGLNSPRISAGARSEEHTSELQSRLHLVCRLLLEKKNMSFAVLARFVTIVAVAGIVGLLFGFLSIFLFVQSPAHRTLHLNAGFLPLCVNCPSRRRD